jgi:ABC-2 type transport system ATP-binding protein
MAEVLKVENVTKTFGKSKVVDDVSFEVMEGDIMGTLGPNGAGKSTLIRNIMGMIYPDSGNISFNIDGERGRIFQSKIGYLPEERGLYKDVTIQDIIFYIADLKDYPKEKAKRRLSEYLEKLDLGGMEKKKVEELSKGMAQKVQFIGAIINEPKFLILDEPFSGLDPVGQDVLMEEIKLLSKNGATILLSSHQMNLVEALCNRIFLINKGKKVIYGTLDDIKEQFADFKCTIYGKNDVELLKGLPMVEKVIGEDDRNTVYISKEISPNQFLKSIPESVNIRELHMDRISLHDIFVHIAKGGA